MRKNGRVVKRTVLEQTKLEGRERGKRGSQATSLVCEFAKCQFYSICLAFGTKDGIFFQTFDIRLQGDVEAEAGLQQAMY